MALNFPNSPTDGQVYTDTPSGNRWSWDSANTCWKSTSTFTQTITVSSTAPGSPVVGQLWWSQDYGRLFVYYNDGTSSQWVEANPADYTASLAYGVANSAFGKANSALQNTSVTLAGNLTVTGNVAVKSNTLSINNINVSPYGMMKNRIINGDMRIDQRFNGAANNNYAGTQYVVDRWAQYGSGAGKLRCQKNNTNGPGQAATQTATGFSNYFGVNVVSANTVNAADSWHIFQPIEGLNIEDLNWGTSVASPVTLSFWVYSSIAGTHGGLITSGNFDRSYPFTYSVSTANTWQRQVITVPGETNGTWWSNNNVGMYVLFPMGIGSNYNGTNDTWNTGGFKIATGIVQPVSAANGAFYLTGVQLEKGPVATAWDWRHYTTELSLCRRYYQGIASGAAGSAAPYIQGVTSGTFSFMHKFDTQMRTSPTVTVSTSGYSTGLTDASTTAPFINTDGFSIRIVIPSSSTWSTGYNWQASAELGVQN